MELITILTTAAALYTLFSFLFKKQNLKPTYAAIILILVSVASIPSWAYWIVPVRIKFNYSYFIDITIKAPNTQTITLNEKQIRNFENILLKSKLYRNMDKHIPYIADETIAIAIRGRGINNNLQILFFENKLLNDYAYFTKRTYRINNIEEIKNFVENIIKNTVEAQ